MAKKDSAKNLDELKQMDKDLHFYRTELYFDRPEEYVKAVKKLISKLEEKKRHLSFETQQLITKEKNENRN